jgi:hypothetical protein
MKWLLVLLGLGLIVVAGIGLVASIDLLTTEIGAVYATCSAIAAAAGLIILYIGALAYRIDALHAVILRQGEAVRRAAAEVSLAPPVAVAAEPPSPPAETVAVPEAVAVRELEPEPTSPPPLAPEAPPIEHEVATLAAPTTLVGRYSSGGANYSIFSDGSIEAETDQGAFHFASMTEFKAYIAAKRA